MNKIKINLNDEDKKLLTFLITQAYLLDDIYDLDLFDSKRVEAIYKNMISRINFQYKITRKEIKNLFLSHKKEKDNIKKVKNLKEYLKISSKNIGAQLLSGYIADKSKIKSSNWFSFKINKFNEEINQVLRLANDYLDLSQDKNRILLERSQLKSQHFLKYNFLIKFRIYLYLLKHKVKYTIVLIFPSRKTYIIAESVLNLGLYVYINQHDSGRLVK